MNKSTEIALTAQIDQLRTALREVFRLTNSGGVEVPCDVCGARPKRSCFDDRPLAQPHAARIERSEREVRQILLASLGRKETDGQSTPG